MHSNCGPIAVALAKLQLANADRYMEADLIYPRKTHEL